MSHRRHHITGIAAIPMAIALLLLPGPRPPTAFACSCMFEEHPVRAAAAEPGTAVFTGIPQPQGPRGVDVLVTRWFTGAPAASTVLLDPAGFEDPMGGSCGVNAPTPGLEWIFVSARTEVGTFAVHLCSPHALVTDETGAAMLADAMAMYGPGTGAPVEGDPTPQALDAVPVPVVVGGTLAAGVLVLLGAIFVARRAGPRRPELGP